MAAPYHGELSALQDALIDSLLSTALLFFPIREASTWEKLDSLYFIVIIHISRIENSQTKIQLVFKIKAVFDNPFGHTDVRVSDGLCNFNGNTLLLI